MKNNMWSRITLAVVPWLILAGMVIGAYLPVFRGQKYLLPVIPRDPRDFFRGNYVDLQYEFSNLSRENIHMGVDPEKIYRFGDQLFLDLKKENDSLKAVGLYDSAEKAKNIRLKVQPRWNLEKGNIVFDLVTGLESYFAPKEAAEEWEKALRERLVFAEVAIDAGGNARLTRLVKKEKPVPAKKTEDEQ